MGHEDQGRPGRAVEREDQVDDRGTGRRIQVSGRFVRKQDLWRWRKRTGQSHALLLPAGQMLGIVLQPARQSDPVQPLARHLARIVRSREFQRQHHVFERGQRRQQLKGLEHEADRVAAQRGAFILVQREKVDAPDGHRTRSGNIQTRQQSQKSGLARTRGTHDRNRLALADAERNIVQNGQ